MAVTEVYSLSYVNDGEGVDLLPQLLIDFIQKQINKKRVILGKRFTKQL